MEVVVICLVALFYGLIFLGGLVIFILKITERMGEKRIENEKKDELDHY